MGADYARAPPSTSRKGQCPLTPNYKLFYNFAFKNFTQNADGELFSRPLYSFIVCFHKMQKRVLRVALLRFRRCSRRFLDGRFRFRFAFYGVGRGLFGEKGL